MTTRIRRAIALWLLREELRAELNYVLAAHVAIRETEQKWVERYWMGRVTAIHVLSTAGSRWTATDDLVDFRA